VQRGKASDPAGAAGENETRPEPAAVYPVILATGEGASGRDPPRSRVGDRR
jgi:hypothetical protein